MRERIFLLHPVCLHGKRKAPARTGADGDPSRNDVLTPHAAGNLLPYDREHGRGKWGSLILFSMAAMRLVT